MRARESASDRTSGTWLTLGDRIPSPFVRSHPLSVREHRTVCRSLLTRFLRSAGRSRTDNYAAPSCLRGRKAPKDGQQPCCIPKDCSHLSQSLMAITVRLWQLWEALYRHHPLFPMLCGCYLPPANPYTAHDLWPPASCSPPTVLRREGMYASLLQGGVACLGWAFPHPLLGQRCVWLLTYVAVVLSTAEVLGKVKRPRGEELAKLAWLTVFCNDGQDFRKQPGGIRVRIE